MRGGGLNCRWLQNPWLSETLVIFDWVTTKKSEKRIPVVATTIVYEQCRKLLDGEVKDFHFYTLNRAELSFAICHILGIRTLKDELPLSLRDGGIIRDGVNSELDDLSFLILPSISPSPFANFDSSLDSKRS